MRHSRRRDLQGAEPELRDPGRRVQGRVGGQVRGRLMVAEGQEHLVRLQSWIGAGEGGDATAAGGQLDRLADAGIEP